MAQGRCPWLFHYAPSGLQQTFQKLPGNSAFTRSPAPRAARTVARAARVVVRVNGFLELLRRVLREQVQRHLDGLLKLRVVPLPDESGVVIHLDVGGDAVPLDLPLAAQSVDGDARRGDTSAVQQLRVVVDADQPAPGLLADERPQSRLAEVPWQGVAA